MGLDMFLKGKRYISKHFNEGDAALAQKVQSLFPELAGMVDDFGGSPVNEVIVEVGYWRKANAIHEWFVNHVQDGEDKCGYYYVSREKLTELKELCERVLGFTHLATDLLPTQTGFFFGPTEYDDYYFSDLRATVQIIDRALSMPKSWDFEYHSSW